MCHVLGPTWHLTLSPSSRVGAGQSFDQILLKPYVRVSPHAAYAIRGGDNHNKVRQLVFMKLKPNVVLGKMKLL